MFFWSTEELPLIIPLFCSILTTLKYLNTSHCSFGNERLDILVWLWFNVAPQKWSILVPKMIRTASNWGLMQKLQCESSMLCFDIFQGKIYSILLKVYHEFFKNHPTKIDFPQVFHKEDCPRKYFELHHKIQVCCALVCSNERSIVSCSRAITQYHQITPKTLSLQPLSGS